jgi:predicted acylesterase/phospholipase RssA
MLPKTSADLEYFYLEPKNQREKSIKGEHIALALQGGGCKGVAYIGAYKAILDCYKGRDIPIRTVIGSSAGGIVGLAICCGVEPSGIVELCEQYLSQVTAERTYGTLE